VLALDVPPLRERRDDCCRWPNISSSFMPASAPRVRGFSKAAELAITAHDWPGNVRELINRVSARHGDGGRAADPAADLGLAAVTPERAAVRSMMRACWPNARRSQLVCWRRAAMWHRRRAVSACRA
jgi:transcriptional regulator with GAF, ATPase, and Fis domain